MMQTLPRMRELIDAFDWEDTPLGARARWPASLQLIVEAALASRFPMLVFWSAGLVQVYNDAFVPILGARHPTALGQAARDCWPEIWDTVGPMLTGAYETGEPVWYEDLPLVLERNGVPEQTYFTFSYSRFGTPHEDGGVLCICTETTAAVTRELAFRATADHIANVIYTHAPDGTVAWANARWYEYTRLPPEIATTPAGWKQVVSPDDYAALLRTLETAFAAGTAYEAEVRIKPLGTADDAYRWHLLRAVPMIGSGGTIVRWAGSATDIHDRRMAQVALRRRLERDLDREHRASLAFQTAALPKSLPEIPGLAFDAIYEAAEKDALVGGDWYDAFRLSDGRVVVSVGDVAGNGLEAAVTMAGARQAIRGAAQVHPDPAAVLDAADRALRSEQPDAIVTAFLAIIDPLTRFVTYASAGHPRPLLRAPDGTVCELAGRGLPLGLRDYGYPAESAHLVAPENATLVLYTDGLTEATRDVTEGERRLRAAVADADVVDSPFPATAIRSAVLAEPNDDIAILAVRFGAPSSAIVRWSGNLHDAAEAARVRRDLAARLAANGASPAEVADAEVVFGELLGNVVRHTEGHVDVALDCTGGQPVLHILDRGPGFTFHARLPNDTMSETGRGLFLTTKLADDVSVTRRHDGGSHARVVLRVRR